MLACPFCAHAIPGAEKFLGKTGRCPKCKGTYRFPATADGDTVGVQPPTAGATPAGSPPRPAAPRAPAPTPARPPAKPAAAPLPQRPAAPRAPASAASDDLLLPPEIPVARIAEPSEMPFPMPVPRPAPRTSGISGNVIGGVLVLVLVLGGGAFAVWRKMDAERCRKFNDSVVKTYGRLEQVTEPIQPQLNAYQVGNPVDGAQLQAGYLACLATIDDVEKSLNAMETPNRATARAFVAKAKEFLDLEREIVQRDIKKMVDLLSDSKLSREEVEREMVKLAPVFFEAQQREQAKVQEVRAAQQAFAKEVGMELR